ncbi:uncharacterized protein LOC141588096 [Silene latifolia]|uniref:uncharacterized protein LOC141588096 n=1 Tax=Silene latifolia TaxID=37657 RepID=UPI003D77920C
MANMNTFCPGATALKSQLTARAIISPYGDFSTSPNLVPIALDAPSMNNVHSWSGCEEHAHASEDGICPFSLSNRMSSIVEEESDDVYCYVLGSNPPFKVVEGFVKRVWGYTEYEKISFHSNGIFLVQFKTEAMKLRVLQAGPVVFDNKPVVVKEWTPTSKLVRETVDMVPIWIGFYGLPLKFWGNALMKIASPVGKPVRVDSNTQLKTFIGHARVMIEVKMGGNFPDVIEFADEMDVVHRQIVHYELKPVLCAGCNGLGHIQRDRRKKQEPRQQKMRHVWVPKRQTQQPVEPAPPVVPVAPEPNLSMVQTQPVGGGYARGVVTPIPCSFTPLSPARILTRLSRQGTQHGAGRRTFIEVLEHSAHYRRDDTNYKVEVLSSEAQVINARVTFIPTGDIWWTSVVYGVNRVVGKLPLWQSLQLMHQVVAGPWVVMGDFNSVLAMDERIGSEISVVEMRDFQDCVDTCGIGDIPAHGSFFTWNNKQEVGDLVFSRIDRAMVNDDWLIKYPDTLTMFHPEGLFDHCPCTMAMKPDGVRKRGSYKYFNMWGKDSEFLKIVKTVWEANIPGHKIFQFVKKLKQLKRPLKELNGANYAQIETTARLAQVMLHDAQTKLQLDPRNIILQKEAQDAALIYKERAEAKRSFLAQKAKVQWLSEGDGNTKFFHSAIKARRMQNKILAIKDMDGKLASTAIEIDEAFIYYYEEVLGGTFCD